MLRIEPAQGYIDLPTGPGLGQDLDDDMIEKREEFTP